MAAHFDFDGLSIDCFYHFASGKSYGYGNYTGHAGTSDPAYFIG